MDQNFKRLPNFMARLVTMLTLGLLATGIFLYLPSWALSLVVLLILTEITLFEWPVLAHLQSWIWWIFPIYIVVPFLLLIFLNEWGFHHLVGGLLVIVSVFDVGAYLIGSGLGSHWLCPKISPRKTWEGVAGGYLFILIVLKLANHFFITRIGLGEGLILAAIVSFFATIGDLSESWLKRRANLKDSGNLLPGQGGFLDRADAFLFLIPLAFILRQYLSKYFV